MLELTASPSSSDGVLSLDSPQDCSERCREDVGVHPNTPPGRAVLADRFHVGNSRGIGAVAGGMFSVVGHVDLDAEAFVNRVDERSDWAIAGSGQRVRLAVDEHLSGDASDFVMRVKFVGIEEVARRVGQVLALKRLPHPGRANFGPRVFGDVLDGLGKFDLQTSRQVKAMLGLHHKRNASLA